MYVRRGYLRWFRSLERVSTADLPWSPKWDWAALLAGSLGLEQESVCVCIGESLCTCVCEHQRPGPSTKPRAAWWDSDMDTWHGGTNLVRMSTWAQKWLIARHRACYVSYLGRLKRCRKFYWKVTSSAIEVHMARARPPMGSLEWPWFHISCPEKGRVAESEPSRLSAGLGPQSPSSRSFSHSSFCVLRKRKPPFTSCSEW